MAVFLSQGTVRDKLKPKKISLKTLGLHFSDMWDIFQEVAVWTSWKLQNQVTKEKPVRMLCVLLPSSVWLFFPCLQWSHPGAEADRCGRRQKGKAKTQHSLSWRSCICSGEGGGGKGGISSFLFLFKLWGKEVLQTEISYLLGSDTYLKTLVGFLYWHGGFLHSASSWELAGKVASTLQPT